jgi:hypothetical protein
VRPMDVVLERLEGVRENGSGFVARCPVQGHGKGRGDREPSLSVSEGDEGKVLLHCHAGCAVEDIIAGVGLSMKDLFEPPEQNGSTRKKVTAIYDYLDEAGNMLHQTVRYEPKDFRQRCPNGNGGWITRGVFKGIRPVLYRLPEVLKTAQEGGTVWVFEGEEDVHVAEQHGLVATTNPMGAGKWRDHYSDFVAGANVVVVPDNDKPGKEHARKVAESARDKAASVKLVELPGLSEGGDFRDWMRNGGTKEELRRLAAETPEVSPSLPPIQNDSDTPRAGPGFVSFGSMERPSDERPFVVKHLVPQRFPTIIFGDGGTAKSLLGASLILDIARGAEQWLGQEIDLRRVPCGYVDFELDQQEQSRRMYQLSEGVGLGKPPDNLYYLCAAGYSAGKVLDKTLEDSKRLGIEVVLLDSLGFALDGDAEASRDVLRFFRRYLDPFRGAGVTLIIVDHQAKLQGKEAYHQKSPFGSVYKRNSTRSVIQVQGQDQRDGELKVRLRCNKANFGPRFEPFEAQISFHDSKVTLKHRRLDKGDLHGEGSLSAADKVRMVLWEGPSYPKDIAEVTQLSLGTVKNVLTRLRKNGEIVPTGIRNGDGAEQMSLSLDNGSDNGIED